MDTMIVIGAITRSKVEPYLILRKLYMTVQSYKLIDPMSNPSEERVASKVKHLRKAFMTAWWKYREDHENVVMGFRRDNKQKPIISPDMDLTVYNAQIEFAYLIDEIERGPIYAALTKIKWCNDLIESLSRS